MKSIFQIFMDQLRTKELWKRVWAFSRFNRFDNFQEYKKRVSRRITKEDIPALVITLLMTIAAIALLSTFFKGPDLPYAFFGFFVLFRVIPSFVEAFQKKRRQKPE